MTKKIITLAYNATKAKLFNADHNARVIMVNLLSYYVEGYEKTSRFVQGRWDGRETFYDIVDDKFPVGFVDIAAQELVEKGYEVQVAAKEAPPPLGSPDCKVDNYEELEIYDYQRKTAEKLVKMKRMIARVSVSGGKTRISKLAHARIGRRTLFLTTRQVLLYQIKDEIDKEGIFSTGIIGDNIYEPDLSPNGFTVAMTQTLSSRLQEPLASDKSADAMRQRRVRERTIEFLDSIDLVIGEEAHEAGGNGYFEVLGYCRNAHYRLALTGTPFMRDGAESNMRLMAAFGSVGINISEKSLIERGILSKPYFIFYPNKSDNKYLTYSTSWQRAIELGITQNEKRNNKIVDFCHHNSQYGLTTLILVLRQEHGKTLNKLLKESGLKGDFVYGNTDLEKRKERLRQLSEGEIDYLIGSNILDVGLNIPSIGALCIAGGGKAEVGHRQRIGRVIRKKPKLPNVSFILDFEDKGNKHLIGHSETRKNIVLSTPGFKDNIINAENFDYESYGFKKVK